MNNPNLPGKKKGVTRVGSGALLGCWFVMSIFNLLVHCCHKSIQVSHLHSGGGGVQITSVNHLHHPHGVKYVSVNGWNFVACSHASINLTLPMLNRRLHDQLLPVALLVGTPLKIHANEADNARDARANNSTNESGNNSVAHNDDWVWALIGYVIGSALMGCILIWWCVKQPNVES